MKIIKTPKFELAAITKGDENADKVALVLPGRLDTKDYVHMTSHVNYLAGLGYYAVSFDPPYSWDSPGSIENYTTTNYIKAVNELIKYFGNRPTFIVGHSRGGSIAALVAAENEYVIGATLLMASFGDPSPPNQNEIKLGYHYTTRDLPPGDAKTEERRSFKLPLSYFKDGKKYNPAGALESFDGPKLIIFATHDEFTKPRAVKEEYAKLGGVKVLMELNTEHDYRYHPDMIDAANKSIGVFLNQNTEGNT